MKPEDLAAKGLARLEKLKAEIRLSSSDKAGLVAECLEPAALLELAWTFRIHRANWNRLIMACKVRGAIGHVEQLEEAVASKAASVGRGEDDVSRKPEPPVLAVLKRREDDVLPVLTNVVDILDGDTRWRGRVRRCLFSDRLEVDGEPVTDAQEGELVGWLSKTYGPDVSTAMVHEALVVVGRRHAYHPVRDYLRGLIWDRQERLRTWLVDFAGCEPDEPGDLDLCAIYGTKWMIGAVARAMEPGCQCDQVLVLRGVKGLKKTSTIRTLCSLPWYSETRLDVESKDGLQQLQGVWIYELGELDTLKRAEMSAVKQFITARVDKFRPPYGRNTIHWPRQCVFAGTTNDEVFLHENDRRFWVRRVVREADQVELLANRDQLWAEAVYRYHHKEPWWLTKDEVRAQKADVEQYRQRDPLERRLDEYIGASRGPYYVAKLLEHPLKIQDPSKLDEMRVAKALENLGFTQRRDKKLPPPAPGADPPPRRMGWVRP